MAGRPALAAAPGASPVARLAGVTQRYGRVEALHDVDVDVPAGRLVGLIGPDGVGKSTLLGLIAGVRRVHRGSVAALGGDMSNRRHRAAICARIAYMPQGLGQNLYGALSVRENIAFFAALFGLPADAAGHRLDLLLRTTGLKPFEDRPAAKLSGGMKQKLGLCCALVHEPDLLILDEPTTGVDPLSRRQFWRLVGAMRAASPGLSVLVATAYMDEAERFDHLIMMDAGRILAEGAPGALMNRAGVGSLEAAYIALLPADKRRGHRAFAARPLGPGHRETAIEARSLTRRFGSFVAVDRVDFAIGRGEIFGFVGPNGCGKSTTMKMLTGLLPVTSGDARLFGMRLAEGDIGVRKRVGYMSQSFSLYEELTVRQNLALHAHLFDIAPAERAARIDDAAERFDLSGQLDLKSGALPLGIRQRLSLAVATIHDPDVLILDEPTSGVDPVARDRFWQFIVDLSRNRNVTVFVSTHYMSEAMRCDRVAFMNAGRVLACDTPAELMRRRSAATLEDAFIGLIEADAGQASADPTAELATGARRAPDEAAVSAAGRAFSPARFLVLARRETRELLRDPFRLAASFVVPLIMMLVFGFGLTVDIERLPYAALDRDRTPESRMYLEHMSGSRYFDERPPARSDADLERRFQRDDIKVAIEIPPGFGRDLTRGNAPEVGLWLDGTKPFITETARGYVKSLHLSYLADLLARVSGARLADIVPANLVTRFWYNQSLRSKFAFVPGLIAVVLLIVPAMFTAVGVVREKELGSITNLYATPVTRLEFLFGKQMPYALLSLMTFAMLTATAVVVFAVPLKGSIIALALGALLFVLASTAIGLLVSSFTRSQAASLIMALIVTLLPAFLYSGLLAPVSSLGWAARIIARIYPTGYFLNISVGAFTKALGIASLWPDDLALLATFVAVAGLSALLIRKQAP